jgi:C-terminal processing protease CtpA/Prc
METYSLFAEYPWDDYFVQRFQGATGLHVRLSDDDRVIVAKVVAELPAESAGIKAGAELISWDGLPARQAVDAALQFFPNSSPQAILNQKLTFFGRLPLGTSVLVDYRNPGESETVSTTLTAVALPDEMDIQTTALCYRVWLDCQQPLVVWVEYLPSGIPVIHVSLLNSDSQKYRLTLDLWQRWLGYLTFGDAPAMIVDLRWPSYSDVDAPGSALSMAGSFFPESFPLAEMTSIDANGNDVTVGTATVMPSPIQWDRPVAVLVDEECIETCELLAYAMSHRPNIIIAGMSATGGSLSGIREPILMPTGNFVQVVDLAYRDPVTHDLLIQGVGIEPTLRIPKTVETLVADVTTDLVMNAAEQALLEQIAGR